MAGRVSAAAGAGADGARCSAPCQLRAVPGRAPRLLTASLGPAPSAQASCAAAAPACSLVTVLFFFFFGGSRSELALLPKPKLSTDLV